MKRYSIIYDFRKHIFDIRAFDIEDEDERVDIHKPDFGTVLICAENILQALEKYKSMTGYEIK